VEEVGVLVDQGIKEQQRKLLDAYLAHCPSDSLKRSRAT